MSYQVARTLTRILLGIILLGTYLLYANNRYQAGIMTIDDLQTWALSMLVFIGIGIAVSIVAEIIFHILFSIGMAVKESVVHGSCNDKDIEKTIKLEMVEDERAKLIDVKSMRAGYVTVGIGFIFSLVFMALGYPELLMLNIVFISFFAAGIVEGVAQLIYYKKGI